MADKSPAFTWQDVIAQLRSESSDAVVHIAVADIIHPLDVGMRRIESTLKDKRPEFGWVVDEKTGCHVVDYGDLYHVRLYVFPSTELSPPAQPEVIDRDSPPVRKREARSWSLTRFVREAPGLVIGGAVLIGVAIGAACALKKDRGEGAATGAGCGLAVGLTMIAVETANTSPMTAEVAQGLFIVLAGAGLAKRVAGRVIRLSKPARATSSASTATKTKTKKRHQPSPMI